MLYYEVVNIFVLLLENFKNFSKPLFTLMLLTILTVSNRNFQSGNFSFDCKARQYIKYKE